MRYAETHKEETRRRVVKTAAGAVRANGPDGVGVAKIMAQAGLTHGGFYAHFPNKEALVAAAIEEAFAQSRRRFGRITDGMAASRALETFVDSYVSMEHRTHPQQGCPASSLANYMPRQGAAVRAAFDGGVRGMIGQIAAWLPGENLAEREGLANSLLAEMSGAVALSRAVSDVALAERLLDECRTRIKARAGLAVAAQD
ncbi:TetR/AcrR family transcriptional regulator [Phenylobacterium hankyongense]|nr:TetR/AcrR family transcriptional regulator [Phenylobacterium hankyongense]